VNLETHYTRDPGTGVWRRPGAESLAYSDGAAQEDWLRRVVDGARDLRSASDELPAHIHDWPSRYHLSPTRANLLRGLRIGPGMRVLEVGAGCGAITRYLGETGCDVVAVEGSAARAAIAAARCRDLPNVRVVQDLFGEFPAGADFDLVTLIGVLEYAPATFPGPDPVAACLGAARACLRPDGALAIAIENRLGLKYFNGCAEDHTGRPFDSLNDLYPEVAAHTWGAQELAAHLARCGFGRSETIWPFPDYKLPRLLVHPGALAAADLGLEYLLGQFRAEDYSGGRLRLFSEAIAWESVCRNGLVPALANSFLVVAWGDGPAPGLWPDDWLVQVFSTDRRAPWRTASRVYRSPAGELRVAKQRLHAGAAPVSGPLRYTGDSDEAWVQGVPWAHALHRLAYQPDAAARYQDYLAQHLAAAQAFAGRAAPDRWPGELFDCIPANLVRTASGETRFIDREWIDTRGLERGYLAFRAVVHDLARLHTLGGLQMFDGAPSVGAWLRGRLGAAGLAASDADLARWVRLEGEAVDQVSLGGTPGFAPLLAQRLAMAPAEALMAVHGATPDPAPAGWRGLLERLGRGGA